MSHRYAVAVGRNIVVYGSWPKCQTQVAGYKGAVFKSFERFQDAICFAKGRHPQCTVEVDMDVESWLTDSSHVKIITLVDD